MANHQDHLPNNIWGFPGVEFQATDAGMGYHQGMEQGLGLQNPFNPGFPNSELIGQGPNFDDVAADIPYAMPHIATQQEGTAIQRPTFGWDDQAAGGESCFSLIDDDSKLRLVSGNGRCRLK
ncbi:hypothetical protein F5Y00DRAFT_236241 [Daldinia vernicosa]|uniref:uncharacterized protein n=1 Tax=Daldinia vernicosa TaxID=114800 RepID=UPI002007FB7E|nr:uncharacterized protein F5Y00DRAFT_236241 [Daldinia vernicosa]KAI0849312.1 hypothetical protein F5Y00DRAFT_236241 [Daldinia vernicosa]